MMKVVLIYVLIGPHGRQMYLGHTHLTVVEQRFAKHRASQLQSCDPLASPFYRHVRENGGWDAWTVEQMLRVQYDSRVLPSIPQQLETMSITTMRRLGNLKLNHDLAIDQNKRKRDAAKSWRDAHSGYVSNKSRENREKRRRAFLAAARPTVPHVVNADGQASLDAGERAGQPLQLVLHRDVAEPAASGGCGSSSHSRSQHGQHRHHMHRRQASFGST